METETESLEDDASWEGSVAVVVDAGMLVVVTEAVSVAVMASVLVLGGTGVVLV